MIKTTVRMLYQHKQAVDILMDASHTETWGELVRLAEDKKAWQLRVRAIKDTINMVKIKKKGKNKG